MERPQTRYVAVGDADVAYQVLGDGPDLLVFNGIGTHLELNWELPDYSDAFRRLASISRLILFDRRGTGASDAAPEDAAWEELSEDAIAVLDAAGSKRASVLAVGDAGQLALLFAAMHPDRIERLVLVGSWARFRFADDYPIGIPTPDHEAMIAAVVDGWGTRSQLALATPSRANDPDFLDRGAATVRSSLTPRQAASWFARIATLDVRSVLPLVAAPTLVLHQRENVFAPLAMGRYLADHIPGARFVELPGGDYGLGGDNGAAVADEVAEFLTGHRFTDADRRLATVLFTDIVNSTGALASMGDRQWRSVLESHDRAVREQLRRFRGKEVNTTGDGFVAAFDGPARAIRCAHAIFEATRELGIDMRAGLHTGECEVRGDDLGGLAVHIAARVGALAPAGTILVSRTVTDLVVGSGIDFTMFGEHDLKGVPGTWQLFAVATP